MLGLLTIINMVVCTNLVMTFTVGYYIRDPVKDFRDSNIDRTKRYTDTQDRSSSFCTGMCMYEERKPYSFCYDLCNWNGRPPSPWTTLDKSKDISVLENANSANLVSNMNSLMRSGGGLGAAGGGSLKMKVGGDKLKLKPNASPTKNSPWNKSNSY